MSKARRADTISVCRPSGPVLVVASKPVVHTTDKGCAATFVAQNSQHQNSHFGLYNRAHQVHSRKGTINLFPQSEQIIVRPRWAKRAFNLFPHLQSKWIRLSSV